MANQEHLDILKQGVEVWNQWRAENKNIRPDLSGANLCYISLSQIYVTQADQSEALLPQALVVGINLSDTDLIGTILIKSFLRHANLSRDNLSGAILDGTDLYGANLCEANLNGAFLGVAELIEANLSETNLSDANLIGANLSYANLFRANLSRANLSSTILVRTNCTEAILTDCRIFGISAWDVKLDGTSQNNLIITPEEESTITVDNLKIAQFIYLLLNNEEIRDAIDTITKKAVLILGRFTTERKVILDALREDLCTRGYLPILFDFDKPASRNITETVSTLAHLARFVIADITDAKSIPQELMAIVPNLPSVPVQPLILNEQHEYGMFEHFTRYSWVLPVYRYVDQESLLQSLQEKVIAPTEQKAQELAEQ